jgi:hypothetical protein
VPERVRKNVVFVGIEEAGQFVPKATAFIVSCSLGGKRFDHFVTAEHVISGMQTKGYDEPLIRLNLTSGEAQTVPTSYNYWMFHPEPGSTDVAVAPANLDRSIFQFTHTPIDVAATDEILNEQKIGVGDEIFICGLFRHHAGNRRNIPIIRTGNIAAMPEEPVWTKYCGNMEAFLIEARSIGGLSGSPVSVHLPPIRQVEGDVQVREEGSHAYYLLGLVHGHFDIKNLNEDAVVDDAGAGGINTGIGVVVPAQKIVETIMQEELATKRQAIIDSLGRTGANGDPRN